MTRLTHDNDNERDTFSAIGLAAMLILNRLSNERQLRQLSCDEKQDEHGRSESGGGDTEKEKADEQRRYVDRRLREIDLFEERAAGRQPWRRR